MKTRRFTPLGFGFLISAIGLALQITLLVSYNYAHNTSASLPIYWAKSPANFLGQVEIYGPSAAIWAVLLVSALILGKFGNLGLAKTIGLISASTSGIVGFLWLDLFLLHNWLGFDDYHPDSSYWWVVALFWFAHALLAGVAIALLRPSKKIGPTD